MTTTTTTARPATHMDNDHDGKPRRRGRGEYLVSDDGTVYVRRKGRWVAGDRPDWAALPLQRAVRKRT
jgi:hypothetical protein